MLRRKKNVARMALAWENDKRFKTFESANERREELKSDNEELEVKVKRSKKDGDFVVKTRATAKEEENKATSKTKKKTVKKSTKKKTKK